MEQFIRKLPPESRAELGDLFRWSQPIQSRHQGIVQCRGNSQWMAGAPVSS